MTGDDFAMFCLLAGEAHFHQVDKAGEPYFLHAMRVGLALLPDLEAACVGVCHDVLEDGDLNHRRALLELCRHRPRRIKAALLRLTRRRRGTYEDYIERLATTGPPLRSLVCRVKVADLEDNLRPGRIAAAIRNGHAVKEERYRAALARMKNAIAV